MGNRGSFSGEHFGAAADDGCERCRTVRHRLPAQAAADGAFPQPFLPFLPFHCTAFSLRFHCLSTAIPFLIPVLFTAFP